MLHACSITSQLSIRLMWPHNPKMGKASWFLALICPIDVSNVSGMVLVQKCLQPGSCCGSLMQGGMSEERCTLTEAVYWPYNLWRCSSGEPWSCRGDGARRDGRAYIWAARRERFQLCWKPRCARGSEKKPRGLMGTTNASYSLISSAAATEQHLYVFLLASLVSVPIIAKTHPFCPFSPQKRAGLATWSAPLHACIYHMDLWADFS